MRILVIIVLAFVWFDQASAQEPSSRGDPILGERLVQGVATDERLWVLSGDGAVVSFARETGQRQTLATEGVAFIGRWNGRTVGLRKSEEGWRVEELESRRSLTAGAILAQPPIGFTRTDDEWLVLTKNGFLTSSGGAWETKAFTAPLDHWGRTNIASTRSGQVYVGFNQGEWGGGLHRLDLRSGTLDEVRRIDDEPCDGPLGHECDPVTGVEPDPANADCVLASIGLSHMLAHGRVLRICDDQVDVVFSRKIPLPPDAFGAGASTWPMFGLAAAPDGWTTISAGKVFRARDGEVFETDMPELEPWHGLETSFADPGFIILKTDMNWGMSLSGYTPLLVPVTN
ncbi:hypothetical protein [Brevundimonas sp.]|uniref:hypothetical protein n=1 Tax=Brevundimonas sp. TaxID=1871086 RepID=UPI0035B2E476